MTDLARGGADVAVIGLGAIGSMTLWRLARRGVSVVGYERFGIGHHRGASGGQTRRFSVVSQRDLRHTQLGIEALRLWRELEREGARSLLTLTGGLLIGAPGEPSVMTAIESLRGNDLEYEVVDTSVLRQRFPQHGITDNEVGVLDRLSGYVHPEVSILSAVESAERRGAVVQRHARVLSVEPHTDGVDVVTEAGRRRYRVVVLAPGPWAPSFPGTAHLGLVSRRLVQTWFVPRDIAHFRVGVFPVFEHIRGIRVYGFPTIDGATVKVGVYSGQPHPEVEDMEEPDLFVEPGFGRDRADTIADFLPGLFGDPAVTSVHFEGYTPDGVPFVGPLKDVSGVVVACGFSGAGFKLAPLTGDIVADYVLDGDTERDVAFMRPSRVSLARPLPR